MIKMLCFRYCIILKKKMDLRELNFLIITQINMYVKRFLKYYNMFKMNKIIMDQALKSLTIINLMAKLISIFEIRD